MANYIILTIFVALVTGSVVLAQSPAGSPTVSPTATPVATPSPAPSAETPAASPPAPPMSPTEAPAGTGTTSLPPVGGPAGSAPAPSSGCGLRMSVALVVVAGVSALLA